MIAAGQLRSRAGTKLYPTCCTV